MSLFTDATEITIPEGAVKNIEDSNGNMIWGSQTYYPYRRLEYIHFNGTDNYLNPGVGTKQGYFRKLEFDLERNNIRQSIFCCYDGTVDNGLRRYYVLDIQPVDNANGTRSSCGNIWSTAVATSNLPLNTKLMVAVVNSTVNSKPRMIFNLTNTTTSTYIISTTTLDGTVNGNLTTVNPYIMGCHTVATDMDILENPTQGKVYYFEERSGNYQGNLTKQLIPVQRKSDNAYGMYDVISNSFIQIQGTQDSTTAGPIIDEYWNLIA